jgi:hypothetical protein
VATIRYLHVNKKPGLPNFQLGTSGTFPGAYQQFHVGNMVNDVGGCGFTPGAYHAHEGHLDISGVTEATNSLYPNGDCGNPCGYYQYDNINHYSRSFTWPDTH